MDVVLAHDIGNFCNFIPRIQIKDSCSLISAQLCDLLYADSTAVCTPGLYEFAITTRGLILYSIKDGIQMISNEIRDSKRSNVG